MTTLVSLDDYEAAAKKVMSPQAWAYIDGGAADEHTLRGNRAAFSRIQLAPRMLRDVHAIDLRVKLLGHDLAHPILLAPVAAQSLAHADAEVGSARGARTAKAGLVLSNYTSRRVEEVAAAGPSPLWFQLYFQKHDATREMIALAEKSGFTALMVTVDTPTLGSRDRQIRAGFEFPAGMPYRIVQPGDNPCTWDDIAWMSKATKLPLILKGILHPDDAELAIQAGAAAIAVSNHGGRNLDTAPPTIEALPRIARRVAGRVPLIVDGGIRRGTDVLKCLALGASGVMIGRPYVHGLAVAGAAGVSEVVEILRREFEQAMALSGVSSISALGPDVIWSSLSGE